MPEPSRRRRGRPLLVATAGLAVMTVCGRGIPSGSGGTTGFPVGNARAPLCSEAGQSCPAGTYCNLNGECVYGTAPDAGTDAGGSDGGRADGGFDGG